MTHYFEGQSKFDIFGLVAFETAFYSPCIAWQGESESADIWGEYIFTSIIVGNPVQSLPCYVAEMMGFEAYFSGEYEGKLFHG